MKLKSLTLFKSTAIYLFANLLNSAIPFALIPILTIYLTPKEYGLIALYTLFVSFLSPFIGLSVHGAITRKYFVVNEKEFRAYLGSSFYLIIGSLALCYVLINIFKAKIASLVGIPADILDTLILISFFQFVILILLSILQIKEKPILYGLLQIGVSVANFSLSYYLVVQMGRGWEGRLYAWEISTLIFALFSIIVLIFGFKLRFIFNLNYIKDILHFSLPLIPHAIGGLIIGLSDRIIISKVLGLSETGIYTISFQVGSVLLVVLTSFNSAFMPWLFGKLKLEDEKIKLKIVAMSYYIMYGIILLILIGYLISPIVFEIFVGKDFQEGKNYLFWMLCSFGLNGMYYLVANYIFYANKTKYLALTTFFVAVLNIPICYFFTKHWGLMGATQSTAIAWFLLFFITWLLSQKLYKMPWLSGFFQSLRFTKDNLKY